MKKKDFTLQKNGLMVFTKDYLLKRGYCCQNGCLNCPYEFLNKKLNKAKTGQGYKPRG